MLYFTLPASEEEPKCLHT